MIVASANNWLRKCQFVTTIIWIFLRLSILINISNKKVRIWQTIYESVSKSYVIIPRFPNCFNQLNVLFKYFYYYLVFKYIIILETLELFDPDFGFDIFHFRIGIQDPEHLFMGWNIDFKYPHNQFFLILNMQCPKRKAN